MDEKGSDRDYISKEKHELDYVLRKWEKRTTQANRDLLSSALDQFAGDPANEPFTRDIFYSFAEKTGLIPKLEGSGSGGGIPGFGEENEPKRKKWWLWALLALLVVVVVLFFLRGCFGCAPEAEKAPVAVPAPVQTAPPQPTPPPVPTPPPKRVVTLAGLPADSLVIRFMPDQTDIMVKGEEAKLQALIGGLKKFDEGSILLTGHAASIGYPKGEKLVSEGRARFIAKKFVEAGVSRDIKIQTRGMAATQMLKHEKRAIARALSRRVELTVE